MRGALHISSSESANIMTNCILGGCEIQPLQCHRCICIYMYPFIYGQRDDIGSKEIWVLYLGLYIIAFGAAGINSNASEFGSDQFDKSNPQEMKAMARSFKMFYLCVDVGSLFAIIVLVYVQYQLINYTYGIGICTGVMTIALALLLHEERSYRYRKPRGSPLTVIDKVLLSAWKNRKLSYPDHHRFLNGHKKLRCLDKAIIVDGSMSRNKDKSNDWMHIIITQVEDVKEVIKLIPIWSTCILFWTVYNQMDTFTTEQAVVMNFKHGIVTIPTSSLSVFLYFSNFLFTSLSEHAYVHIAKKKWSKRTHKPSKTWN
ncbi:putative ABC-type nitrate transporter [Helianthus annuus]|nr:putative ABC-type nitrate transporter [Helianthus annuus]KAJ0697602.1 putative ABC-type nitrate transporter [Helianthus annuus]KAJ0884614.1 putative ABC-type nitrate transporter [Helianthus annuus]